MTLSQCIRMANRRGLATADFMIEDHAAYVALPQFLRDVRQVLGEVYWMAKIASFTFTTATRIYSLPSDFKRFRKLQLETSSGVLSDPLLYLNERPEDMISAEFNTTPSCPSAYYVQHKTGGGFELKLASTPDNTYSAKAVYDWQIPIASAATDPELNEWLPADIQGLFSQKLRCDILMDAYGQGDGRYVTERQEYQNSLESLTPTGEASRHSKVVYVR